EDSDDKDFQGKVHYFNHGAPEAFYAMGVTLAAGYSLTWFKETFAPEETFDYLLADIKSVAAGANGLLFTSYIARQRTLHADSGIMASLIGIDRFHERKQVARAVVEGITFNIN